MIEFRDVINIHNILIDRLGGIRGVRDTCSLESAINIPFATFEGQDLYPTPIEKQQPFLKAYSLTTLLLTEIKGPHIHL